MRAMILAAGLGQRMEPLSLACPKPALPILDVPLVLHMVRHLAGQGVERVVVNTHVQPRTLHRALAEAPIPVDFSHEEVLLGSAGGIRAARALLEGTSPFLVLNADMWIDLDVGALLARHRQAGAIATVALREDPRKQAFGTIGYDRGKLVRRITDRISTGPEYANGLFIGVQVMEPAIFGRMPQRSPLGTMDDVYVPMLASGEALAVWLQPAAADWWPVGRPGELLEANQRALERATDGGTGVRSAPDARVEGEVVAPAWVGSDARVAAGARVGPWTVVGRGAVVPAESTWSRALLLPNSRPPAGCWSRAIAHGEGVWRGH